MVLVVVIFERLARHVGGERIMRIGQVGQRERHRITPRMVKRVWGITWATGWCRPRFRGYSLGRSEVQGNGTDRVGPGGSNPPACASPISCVSEKNII